MMLALMMPFAQATPAPAPPDADEVVVIGERMRELKLSLKTDKVNGGYYCKFKRRSVDPAFDALMCNYAKDCAKAVAKWNQFEGCMTPKVEAYARELVTRRRATAAQGH